MEQKRIGAGFGVMILNNDHNVLLGRRHSDPAKASSALHGEGTWTLPGGKLHFGETFEAGAKREVFEETGIEIFEDKVKLISLSNDRVEDAHFITAGLVAEEYKGEAKVMEPDEITEWNWFSFDALPQPLFFASQTIIKNYLGKSFYSRPN